MTFQPEIHSQSRAHIQRSLNDQRLLLPVRDIDTKYRSQDTREAAHDDHHTLSRPKIMPAVLALQERFNFISHAESPHFRPERTGASDTGQPR